MAPPNIGPRTNSISYKIPDGTSYEQFFVDNAGTSVIRPLSGNEGRVFVGPRDDGFSVDLGAVFDLAGLETVLGGTPFDNVAGYNVHTIALEIPLEVANGNKPVTMGATSTPKCRNTARHCSCDLTASVRSVQCPNSCSERLARAWS